MKRALLGLALAALLPMSAQAADGDTAVSYNYVEGSYQSSDLDSIDFDGFGIAGSFGFANNWYASGSFRNVDADDFDAKIDETKINLGWHHGLSANADFIAEIGYVNFGAEIGSYEADSDGFSASVGFRGKFSPNFEAGIKASYIDVSDIDTDFAIGVNGIWHINETWGIVGSYDHMSFEEEGMDTWGLGVRASF
jgi:Ax21 family sulfation-dependent quorum factor